MQPTLFSKEEEQFLMQVAAAAAAAAANNGGQPMNFMPPGFEGPMILPDQSLFNMSGDIAVEQQTSVNTFSGNMSDNSNDDLSTAAPLGRRLRRGRNVVALSDEEPVDEELSLQGVVTLDNIVGTNSNNTIIGNNNSNNNNNEHVHSGYTNQDEDNGNDEEDDTDGRVIGVKRRRMASTTTINSQNLGDGSNSYSITSTTATLTATTEAITGQLLNNTNTNLPSVTPVTSGLPSITGTEISGNGIKLRIRYPAALKAATHEEEGEEGEPEVSTGRSLRIRNRRSYAEPSEADLEAALVSDDVINEDESNTKLQDHLHNRRRNNGLSYALDAHDEDDNNQDDYMNDNTSSSLRHRGTLRQSRLSLRNHQSTSINNSNTEAAINADHDHDTAQTRRSSRLQRQRQSIHSDDDDNYVPMDEDHNSEDNHGTELNVEHDEDDDEDGDDHDDDDDDDGDYGRPRRRSSARANYAATSATMSTGGKTTQVRHSTMELRTRRSNSTTASNTNPPTASKTVATGGRGRNLPARSTKRGFLDRLRETAGMTNSFDEDEDGVDMKNVEKYVPTGRAGLRQRNRVNYQRLDNGQPVPPSVSAQAHHHHHLHGHLEDTEGHEEDEDEDGLNGTPRKYRLRTRAAPKNYDEVSYFNSMLESNMRKAEQNANGRRGGASGPNAARDMNNAASLNFANPNRRRVPRGGHAFMFRFR
ncbi:hypothetical protein BDF19DRAFT_211882 [Syncephalis fuscata]|nr:hypothetical protein BDF19DRAFT_211882 [Syncephalis fuscata]